jgi:hypothetical protein
LELIQIKDNNYIENEKNPINIFNKICGVINLKGQENYFNKIDISEYFYIGQVVYYEDKKGVGGGISALFEIVKYDETNVIIKNKISKNFTTAIKNIKPFYFYIGQIILDNTNKEFEIMNYHTDNLLTPNFEIEISPYELSQLNITQTDYLVDNNKAKHLGLPCIIKNVNGENVDIIYDKLILNISEIDTTSFSQNPYVGQYVIFDNVKYKIKNINGADIEISSSLFSRNKNINITNATFYIYKGEKIQYNNSEYKILSIKNDIVFLQPSVKKVKSVKYNTLLFENYIGMKVLQNKEIYKIEEITGTVIKGVKINRELKKYRLKELYSDYKLKYESKFYKFYVEAAGINIKPNEVEYSNNAYVFYSDKPSFQEAKTIFNSSNTLEPKDIYKYNEYCSPIIYSDNIEINNRNKICTNLTNEIQFNNSFKNMLNKKTDNITCPSDGNYGYMNCLYPNLNPGKINDLNYKNTYSFCVLNTDNGSEYSDFIDCNDQNITNNYDITEFINTLNPTTKDNNKKYILELGKYNNNKIESANIKEDSTNYNINIETEFDTSNNLIIKLINENKQDITKDINHTFDVFSTCLYAKINGKKIKCEKIKV